jgi:large subunit ribosomal protein L11
MPARRSRSSSPSTRIARSRSSPRRIKQAIGIASGSSEPHRLKVGKITQAQIREIAERKLNDLNANDLDQASKIIAGTARSMGVDVV